jgi:hypothetical protein
MRVKQLVESNAIVFVGGASHRRRQVVKLNRVLSAVGNSKSTQQQLLGLGQHVQLPTRQTRPSNRALVCATSSHASVAKEFQQTFNLKEKAGKELTTALMSQRQHVEQANSELLSISQQIRVLEMVKLAIDVSLLNSNECLAKAETHRDAWETDFTCCEEDLYLIPGGTNDSYVPLWSLHPHRGIDASSIPGATMPSTSSQTLEAAIVTLMMRDLLVMSPEIKRIILQAAKNDHVYRSGLFRSSSALKAKGTRP